MPTFSTGLLIGLFILIFFPKLSKISLVGSFIFWNPFFIVPIYALGYKMGNYFLGVEPIVKYNFVFWNKVLNITKRLLVGNLLIAIIVSISFYILIHSIVNKYQKNRIIINIINLFLLLWTYTQYSYTFQLHF